MSKNNKVAKIILMCGQSNMDGNSYVKYLPNILDSNTLDSFTYGTEEVKINYIGGFGYNHSNYDFLNVKLGQGVSKDHFGPEIGLSKVIIDNSIKDIFLIKLSLGNSSLINDWYSFSIDNKGSELYNYFIHYVNLCISKLEEKDYKVDIISLLFMQGESDAFKGLCEKYEYYLDTFYKDIKSKFSIYLDKKFSFIDALISDSPYWEEYKIINDSKISLSNKYNDYIIVDTIKNNLSYNKEPYEEVDYAHYDSQSEYKLGILYGEALLNFLKI